METALNARTPFLLPCTCSSLYLHSTWKTFSCHTAHVHKVLASLNASDSPYLYRMTTCYSEHDDDLISLQYSIAQAHRKQSLNCLSVCVSERSIQHMHKHTTLEGFEGIPSSSQPTIR